ncbi:MAG: NAD(P)/FAD-dependent oxidoreductase, partial [Clostridia bacterium]|nr:NAD(P)/FAD-dependent oxidoreductase [Clostridia bacterium]
MGGKYPRRGAAPPLLRRRTGVSGAKAVVVGAGPAGMMAALTAAEQGISVTLVEKNKAPGKKLAITGKGRCNVTSACDRERFFEQIPRNPKFLYTAYANFDNQDTIRFFEDLGVPLKTERGERVFPQSDRAADICDALVKACRKSGVRFVRGEAASIVVEDGAVTGLLLKDKITLPAEAVVLATGGLSYPVTGSTGDGYRMAEQLGHTLTPPWPSLVPLVTEESWPGETMGLSLRNVRLTLWQDGRKKPLYEEQGELLFTHFGLSGPLVLSASTRLPRELGRHTVSIDLKPALTPEQLDARLLRDFEEYHNRDFSNALDKLLPRKLIPVVVALSGIPPHRKVHSITREERRALVTLLKGLQLTVKDRRPIEEAIVTAGGIPVREVEAKTMQSRLVRGLYFAGEL